MPQSSPRRVQVAQVHCGAGALGVEWARLHGGLAEHVDGAFAAVRVRGQAASLHLKPGDVLVGLDPGVTPKFGMLLRARLAAGAFPNIPPKA